jgi:hypothetical protein
MNLSRLKKILAIIERYDPNLADIDLKLDETFNGGTSATLSFRSTSRSADCNMVPEDRDLMDAFGATFDVNSRRWKIRVLA